MQTCKEWKVKDAELFKRTKELGYNRRDAKKLLAFWGDWWWREEADEGKDEEEEEEEEEEMEEEIEELGLPKSITSAGEESSSNRLHQLMQWNMTGKRQKKKPRKRRCYKQLQ
jgi:hypothetical protein